MDHHRRKRCMRNLYSLEPQTAEGHRRPAILQVLRESDEYMSTKVFGNESMREEWLHSCRNQHASCSLWAATGACHKNRHFMELQCAPACQVCHRLRFENRCPPLSEQEQHDALLNDVWREEEGDLDRTFLRILEQQATNTNHLYSLQLLSGPRSLTKDDNVPDGPWVMVFDDFLTPPECEVLVELGRRQGFQRSTSVGSVQTDGSHTTLRNSERTSSNTWCVEDRCYHNNTVQAIHQRMFEVGWIYVGSLEERQRFVTSPNAKHRLPKYLQSTPNTCNCWSIKKHNSTKFITILCPFTSIDDKVLVS